MAFEQRINPIAVPSSGDLSASQFCFVALDSSGRAVLPSAGADAVGVLQDKPKSLGDASEVQPLDGSISKVLCGGTITAGAQVATDVAGKAVAAVSTNFILGNALEAGATGKIISVLLLARGAKP
jgi:hypothetical protein